MLLELLLARNAPMRLRRVLVIVALIICAMWTSYYTDVFGISVLEFEPSDWLTYVIGLLVSALLPTLVAGIYCYLPRLGRWHQWEWALSACGLALFAYIVVENESYGSSTISFANVLDRILLDLPEYIVGAIVFGLGVPMFVKVVAWVVRGPAPRRS